MGERRGIVLVLELLGVRHGSSLSPLVSLRLASTGAGLPVTTMVAAISPILSFCDRVGVAEMDLLRVDAERLEHQTSGDLGAAPLRAEIHVLALSSWMSLPRARTRMCSSSLNSLAI